LATPNYGYEKRQKELAKKKKKEEKLKAKSERKVGDGPDDSGQPDTDTEGEQPVAPAADSAA
jgi:hypothetical protein